MTASDKPESNPIPDNLTKKAQFNVYLPTALITEVKHRAIDDNTSLSALVEAALTAYLQNETKEQ